MQGMFKRGHKKKSQRCLTHPRSGKAKKKKKRLSKCVHVPRLQHIIYESECLLLSHHNCSKEFKHCSQENTQQEKEQVAFNYNKEGFSQLQASLPQTLSLTKRQT